jgi:hypothetical protein
MSIKTSDPKGLDYRFGLDKLTGSEFTLLGVLVVIVLLALGVIVGIGILL